MKWNKYTLKTRTEAEDIISSMMMDVGVEGIEIEDKVPLTEQDKAQMFVDIMPIVGEDDGTAYISFYLEPEMDQEEMLRKVREGLEEISEWMDIGEGTIVASETEDKDWINNWKEYFHQFYVDDILIKPSWEEVKPEDKEKLLIQIDPGTAFGTGMHETTQLCIKQLKKYVNDETKLLDVGTGSGILSIIALKLGAKYAVGTDLDPNAICAANENMEANDITKEQFEVYIGNVIDDEKLREDIGLEAYDIVVANILADIIIPLQKVVHLFMKPGAIFISSGIINMKEQAVLDALNANENLEVLGTEYQGEWVSICARRK